MCNACLPTPDAQSLNSGFAERMLDMLNQGAMALMVSIGHRTGLFDAMSELPPAPAEQIAAHTGLHERYVREWLAAMVVGRIIMFDPRHATYHLPDEHAALLTRAASPDNIAVFTQYIAVLGQVEDRVVDCFRQGGGVDYVHYPRFHEVMAEDSNQTVIAALDRHIIPLIAGLETRLRQGIRVLDIGCGRGHALQHLARRYPASTFHGYELSRDAVREGNGQAHRQHLDNLLIEQKDLTHFHHDAVPDAFDLVTAFDAIHDQAAPQHVLDGIHRTLKPGGDFLMQDIRASSQLHNNLDHPIGALLYTVSTMHCMTVSLAQGGAGLGTMWGEELAVQMLADAGFTDITVHQLEHDFQNNFYVTRKTG